MKRIAVIAAFAVPAGTAAAEQGGEPVGVAVVVFTRAPGDTSPAEIEGAICAAAAPRFLCVQHDAAAAAVVGRGARSGAEALAALAEALDVPYAVAVDLHPGDEEAEVEVEVFLHVRGSRTGIFRSASGSAGDAGALAAVAASGLLRDADARGRSGAGDGRGSAAGPAGAVGDADGDDGTVDLAVSSTLQGIAVAWASTSALRIGDARAIGPLLLLGGGLGFTGSFLAAHYAGIGEAEAQIVGGAGWWGLTEGFLLAKTLGESDWARVWAWSLVGWGAGMGIGITVAATAEVSRGDVALVNSAAAWGLFCGAMLGGTILGRHTFTTDVEQDFSLPFAGLNVGVAAGVLASRWVDVSRGRMVMIDLAGLLGALLGGSLGTPLIIDDSSNDRKRWYNGVMLGSAALGLALGAIFTSGMDAAADGIAAAALIDVEPDGSVSLGIPVPRPHIEPDREGDPSLGLWVPLAVGAW
ncbi:MAG: hypothetical protein QME96_04235 [Myxococcota bacterium]|nr:hypothetical protein [Myxococcota bacterium]